MNKALFLVGLLVVSSVANHVDGVIPDVVECDTTTCDCDPNDPSQCLACLDTFFKIDPHGDRCELCPGDFCTSCEEPYVCETYDLAGCITEKGVNGLPNVLGTACFVCDLPECAHCFTTGYCEMCNPDFLFNPISGTCYQCPEGCSDCDPDTLECFECADPTQKPNTDGTACVDCNVLGCFSCDSADVCAVCEDIDFKPNSEGVCVFCPGAFCDKCEVAGVCSVYRVCPGADELPNVAGSECFDCDIPDCEFCSADGECEQCGGPLRPSVDGAECNLCPTFCAACSDDGVCAECVFEGFKPNEIGDSCFACPAEFCNSCDIDGDCTEYAQCPGLMDLPNVAATDCFECNVDDCDNCFFKNRCEKCSNAQDKLNLARNKCSECLVLNCDFCSADGVCEQCASGFEVVSNGQACAKIIVPKCDVLNCVKCAVKDNVCTACADGFIVNAGKCIPKPILCNIEKCDACLIDNVCSKCADGYIEKNGQCALKPILCNVYDCKECLVDNVCNVCNAGFEKVDGKCKQIPKEIKCEIGYCKECSADNVCKACFNGLIPNSNGSKCVKEEVQVQCASFCAECESRWKCTKCKDSWKKPDAYGTWCV